MRSSFIGIVITVLLACGCTTQSAPRPPAGNDSNNNTNANSEVNDNQPSAERFTLVANTVGGGSVEPSAGTFEAGEGVTLTATPDAGWRFDHWEGDVTGQDAVIVVIVTQDVSLTAFFVKLPSPPPPPPDNTNDNAGNDNSAEPGSGFESATLVQLDASGSATLDESLLRAADVHVYDLGPMALGDLVSADCAATGLSQLDPLIALFDADGFRVFWNDDVDLQGGDFSARVSGLIRHDSAQHFLAVTSTDFAETSGSYRLTVEVVRGLGAPSVSGQTIVIDFDGAAAVTVAGLDHGDAPPFDAEAIHSSFAGGTETLKATILDVVRADFAAFDLTVFSTDDPAPTGLFTTVFMGGDNDELLGIADNLDFYNANHDDNVIVFTLAFSGLTFDLADMGQAIGNVVSHEVGHSLGLMHTLDGTELMDNSGSDLPLLSDQSFGTAPVFDFPIGLQNAPLLLDETLGPATAKRIPSRIGGLRCGTCGLPLEKLTRMKTGQAR